jgi:hypothetical protein
MEKSMSMVERVARAICASDGGVDPSMETDPDGAPAWTHYVDFARAAIEAMGEPTEEQLDAVRRIVQWHNFDRPTEASLIRHCKALGKEPPAECRDVEHVPPTNMVSYWIYSGMIDAALKEQVKA